MSIESGETPSNAKILTRVSNAQRAIPMPLCEELKRAFDGLGTQSAVAAFYGVSRRTIARWVDRYGLVWVSRPEVKRAEVVRRLLADPMDRVRVAQWVIDEASITIAYDSRTGTTSLLVTGGMSDDDAISMIAEILNVKVLPGATPSVARFPMEHISMRSADAYALLDFVRPELTGLKAMEAEAALRFFPPSGLMKGRHTTDEFLAPVWRRFAKTTVRAWNKRRRIPLTEKAVTEIIDSWVASRIARARRFLK